MRSIFGNDSESSLLRSMNVERIFFKKERSVEFDAVTHSGETRRCKKNAIIVRQENKKMPIDQHGKSERTETRIKTAVELFELS